MNNSATSRDKSKSPSHCLAHLLEHDVGLNKAQIQLTTGYIVDYIQEFYPEKLEPGTFIHCAVSKDEPAGKPIKNCKVVPIRLTTFHRTDIDVMREEGSVEMRSVKLLRWCNEAYEQGALLSQEDLSLLLNVDRSTVKDIIGRLRGQGIRVPTRGAIQDIGPEPSHKKEIANLLGRGMSTSKIRAITKHSEHAIARYQYQFGLVIHLLRHYPDAHPDEICIISDLSPKAYAVYIEVYCELSALPHCESYLERIAAFYELDPEGIAGCLPPGKKHRYDPVQHLEEQTLSTNMSQIIQQDLNTTARVAEVVTEDLMEAVHENYLLSPAIKPGETVITVDAHDPENISGERSPDRPLIPVKVPLHTQQMKEIWRRKDIASGRKKAIIAAVVADAVNEQGGIMSIANLAELLHTSSASLSEQLRKYAVDLQVEAQTKGDEEDADPTLPHKTKGYLEDAGPTLSHKNWIIDLDKHGVTGELISRITRHVPLSRDRYIETYRRAETIMRLEKRIPDAERLSRLMHIRRNVAEEYVQLLRRYHSDAQDIQGNPSMDRETPIIEQAVGL